VVLDITLPGASGYDICEQIKAREDTRLIPVIMITALNGLEDKIRGIEAGADDFLTKPFSKLELLTRIKSLVRMKRLNEDLESATNIILTLALALEANDEYTQGHSERVAHFAVQLGEQLGLPDDYLRMLRVAGLLHDIGKIGIKESILNKTGKLSEEELAYVRTHAVIGEKICQPLRSLRAILPVIRQHGERYDGEGLPDGLKGERIDLGARIVAVVDAYDAITSDRPYRRAMTKEEAVRVLRDGAGTQWDPALVDHFVKMIMKGQKALVA
ncbi:MAG: HD domain-containing protein, partial [Dehalococcoidales bacterium]|nr:HD domain-containing protein [Dehalococcoidales bacterium]